MLAFVAGAAFGSQPKLIDGASGLLRDIWCEENGIDARSAIGTSELPGNITVEIEFIFELKDKAL
jgi:enamine deaminase RidA (YjgF/YER057c/UK114 family)